MRYASLASGSKGNCHAFKQNDQILLVDAGTNCKQIQLRLAQMGWELDQVRGVCITHEHSDHIAALPVLLKRSQCVILATALTRKAIEKALHFEIPENRYVPIRAGHHTAWEAFDLLPFATPHDAEDPVAYRIEGGGLSMAVVTDLGHVTALAVDHCQDLDVLALESNHDIEMLREGEYPPHLKSRILSRTGHLSNGAAADLLSRIANKRLKQVVLAHLSEENNAPELARFAAEAVLNLRETTVQVASQTLPMEIGHSASVSVKI